MNRYYVAFLRALLDLSNRTDVFVTMSIEQQMQ